MSDTTVSLTQETKQELIDLKNHPQETYEKLIRRMIAYMKEDMEDILTKKDLSDIKKSITQYEKGNFKTQSQMKAKYGLK